jgi:hypothetical protein
VLPEALDQIAAANLVSRYVGACVGVSCPLCLDPADVVCAKK